MSSTCLNRLRELCVKLMFLHPVDYGRKAEELLWRKVYYEVIQVIKTNKKVCFHLLCFNKNNCFHDDSCFSKFIHTMIVLLLYAYTVLMLIDLTKCESEGSVFNT